MRRRARSCRPELPSPGRSGASTRTIARIPATIPCSPTPHRPGTSCGARTGRATFTIPSKPRRSFATRSMACAPVSAGAGPWDFAWTPPSASQGAAPARGSGCGYAINVALYARVSSDGQTPENQLQPLRAFTAARGWAAVGFLTMASPVRRTPASPRCASWATVGARKVDVVWRPSWIVWCALRGTSSRWRPNSRRSASASRVRAGDRHPPAGREAAVPRPRLDRRVRA